MMKTTNMTATHKQAAMPVRCQAMRAIARPCTVIARAVAVAAAATQEAPSGKRAAKVAFQLEKHVEYGEEVCLVGEKDLGGWDAQAAVCLSWHDGDVWSTEFELPTGSHLEYKYIIRKPSGEVVQWQPIPTNLELDVPESASLTVVDAWDTPGRCDLNTHAPSNGTAAMEAAADDNVQELPAPKAVVVASADDGADDDVVPAYLDDEDQDEWDGGASGGAANGILEAIAAQGVVTGSAGAAGKRGVVVAAAALASEDDDQGPQDDVKNKMPRTLSAVKRELRAAGLPTNGNKSDLFERLRQALTGSA